MKHSPFYNFHLCKLLSLWSLSLPQSCPTFVWRKPSWPASHAVSYFGLSIFCSLFMCVMAFPSWMAGQDQGQTAQWHTWKAHFQDALWSKALGLPYNVNEWRRKCPLIGPRTLYASFYLVLSYDEISQTEYFMRIVFICIILLFP